MFLRKSKRREPVPVTMSGVRMGERLLQIGVDDPAIAGAIAAKVGLSGSAAAVATDANAAARIQSSASEAGVLVEVQQTPLDRLSFATGAFDVVVVHALGNSLPAAGSDAFGAAAAEWFRVLRHGGRVVVIEPGARSGLGAILQRSAPAPSSEALAALERNGFRPVRVVGELEGFKFTEGLKS